MRRFFSSKIDDHQILLNADESKHLKQVLRASEGDSIEVLDGKGKLYECTIISLSKKETIAKIRRTIQSEVEVSQLWMAVAPTKNINRWEWFLEKSTEIGIGRISPLNCVHSERKVLKQERQERILKEAVKQSKQLYLPQLDPMTDFLSFIDTVDYEEKYIAHCYPTEKKKLKDLHQKGKKALILIGPEGDFDQSEVDRAEKNGFIPIDLGTSRLRTETAAIAACHSINLLDA